MTMIDARNAMMVLDESECWRLLAATAVGRLAVSIANHPDIFPVNHLVDQGTIVFRTSEGTKLAAATLGIGVAFEIDGYDPEGGQAWSVVAHGVAHEIEALDELMAAEELPLFPWNTSPKHRWVRVQVDEVSGRRFEVVPGAAPTA